MTALVIPFRSRELRRVEMLCERSAASLRRGDTAWARRWIRAAHARIGTVPARDRASAELAVELATARRVSTLVRGLAS